LLGLADYQSALRRTYSVGLFKVKE
jgi:hypothetical protein